MTAPRAEARTCAAGSAKPPPSGWRQASPLRGGGAGRGGGGTPLLEEGGRGEVELLIFFVFMTFGHLGYLFWYPSLVTWTTLVRVLAERGWSKFWPLADRRDGYQNRYPQLAELHPEYWDDDQTGYCHAY